jgi:hypothetical protein
MPYPLSSIDFDEEVGGGENLGARFLACSVTILAGVLSPPTTLLLIMPLDVSIYTASSCIARNISFPNSEDNGDAVEIE